MILTHLILFKFFRDEPPATGAVGGGSSSKGRGSARRRRYILPDGTNVVATLQEVQDLLETFIVPDASPAKASAVAKALSVRKGSEPKLDLVKFEPIRAGVTKVKLEAPWRVDTRSEAYAEALRQMAWDEDEDEAISLLLVTH